MRFPYTVPVRSVPPLDYSRRFIPNYEANARAKAEKQATRREAKGEAEARAKVERNARRAAKEAAKVQAKARAKAEKEARREANAEAEARWRVERDARRAAGEATMRERQAAQKRQLKAKATSTAPWTDRQDTLSRIVEMEFDCSGKFRVYQEGAMKRKLIFTLTIEEAAVMFQTPCHYCEYAPRHEFNGIDRVDNTVGYVPENCVACCKWCNRAKGHASLEAFMEWVHWIRPELRPTAEKPPAKRVIGSHDSVTPVPALQGSANSRSGTAGNELT